MPYYMIFKDRLPLNAYSDTYPERWAYNLSLLLYLTKYSRKFATEASASMALNQLKQQNPAYFSESVVVIML